MQQKVFAIAALASGMEVLALGQQQPGTFFKDRIKLQDADIQRIQQGQVVTKVLESSDQKYGLLVFGAVYVNAPIAEFAKAVRDIKKLMGNRVYLAVQEFSPNGTAPARSDFDRLELERKDVDKLQDCHAGDCEIQIVDFEESKKHIDWKSKDKYLQVNQVFRDKICQGMTLYMSGGMKSLGSYRDRKKPLNLYEANKSMVDQLYYLPRDKAPEIYDHVVAYPQGKIAGVQDIFYWEKIDFGQEPTIRINHLSLFPQGVGPVKFLVTNKQLYASRYMRVALQTFFCIPDTQNPAKPGFFLIEMNDSRLPDFGGVKLSVVRKVAAGKAVDATRDMLQMYQKQVAGL